VNALRLMLGTLTVLRVPPPTSVDRGTAGAAMLLAPLGGLVLAVPLVLLTALDASSLLVAALAVGALALLTRALHLDGLADTADGLGSGHPGAEALEVMRRSDIGPFGVVTLLLVLLVQVTALASLVAIGFGPPAVLAALLVSRGVLPVLCTSAFPAARAHGLGQAVAASVSRGAAAVSLACVVVVAALGAAGLAELASQGWLTPSQTGFGWYAVTGPGYYGLPFGDWWGGSIGLAVGGTMLVGGLLAVAAAVLLARRCVRRFGGVTGDVYGACVELAFTTMLVVPALLLT
jgi:adenosylcobinamide-GDP ribazoletransferase